MKDRQICGEDGEDSEEEHHFLQRLMSQYLANITLRGIHGALFFFFSTL